MPLEPDLALDRVVDRQIDLGLAGEHLVVVVFETRPAHHEEFLPADETDHRGRDLSQRVDPREIGNQDHRGGCELTDGLAGFDGDLLGQATPSEDRRSAGRRARRHRSR